MGMHRIVPLAKKNKLTISLSCANAFRFACMFLYSFRSISRSSLVAPPPLSFPYWLLCREFAEFICFVSFFCWCEEKVSPCLVNGWKVKSNPQSLFCYKLSLQSKYPLSHQALSIIQHTTFSIPPILQAKSKIFWGGTTDFSKLIIIPAYYMSFLSIIRQLCYILLWFNTPIPSSNMLFSL